MNQQHCDIDNNNNRSDKYDLGLTVSQQRMQGNVHIRHRMSSTGLLSPD